jgi:chromosome partitioning protein
MIILMARVIAVASQKGGVAKTTSTISIGAELAAVGKRTLVLDMDPQGHLAEGFGLVADELEASVSQVLADDAKIPLVDILIPVAANLHLAPSNIYLADLELEMVSMVRREDRLKHALEPVKSLYDYILIDCPPSLGILTVNAFSAANQVLVPMACEFYSLLGVGQLSKSVIKMRRVLNPELSIIGILPTRKRNTNHAVEVIERAKSEFPCIRVFAPAIPEAVVVTNASAEGKSLIEFSPTSPARLAYQSVTKELCRHGS